MNDFGMSEDTSFSPHYASLLTDIKQRIRHAQTRAMLAVSAELIRLYWEIGALIDTRQQNEGWGAGVIPRLARDLHNQLPEEKGFSERNIKRMLAFYREYPTLAFVPLPVAQTETATKVPQAAALFSPELILTVPWGHHAVLMEKIKDAVTRQWYMRAAVENGWSRNVLLIQIETAAHARLGQAASNFALRLPAPDSEGAYSMTRRIHALHVGNSKAFADTQRIPVRDRVLQARRVRFKEFPALICNSKRYEQDAPTIGLLLCKSRNKIIAEYALRDNSKPIGVAEYQIAQSLPEDFADKLPSIERIEQELQGGWTDEE